MKRSLHLLLVLCLLGIGMAEAVELPELADGHAVEADLHNHHSESAATPDSADRHCAKCCHAPCHWVGAGAELFDIESLVQPIPGSSVPGVPSRLPVTLLRPPIS